MIDEPRPASPDGEADDHALMLAYAAGDMNAFDALYARHKGPVFRFFQRQLTAADAEECHQDVWLKVIKARASYRPSGSFAAFVFTIAHNVLTDRHRRHMRRVPTRDAVEPDELPSGDGDQEGWLDTERAHRQLCALLANLPIAQREAWLMQQEGGMSLEDIATVTGSTREGVKSRLRYAAQKLRTGMQNHVRTA